MVRRGAVDKLAMAELTSIPNIGPRMAEDLIRLGMRRPQDLRGADPDDLYERLCRLDGVRHDICCLDVFRAAVDYADGKGAKPWWEYSRDRKSGIRPFPRAT
ncbi:MAG: helix-hairpin-helix domain-containing protein [Deltaproteobacteria bacterium]|nr:helix-hairpin-helix domain-containing protein [Deltaproteobacteria bacterium]